MNFREQKIKQLNSFLESIRISNISRAYFITTWGPGAYLRARGGVRSESLAGV